jgi:hypothetical protein
LSGAVDREVIAPDREGCLRLRGDGDGHEPRRRKGERPASCPGPKACEGLEESTNGLLIRPRRCDWRRTDRHRTIDARPRMVLGRWSLVSGHLVVGPWSLVDGTGLWSWSFVTNGNARGCTRRLCDRGSAQRLSRGSGQRSSANGAHGAPATEPVKALRVSIWDG